MAVLASVTWLTQCRRVRVKLNGPSQNDSGMESESAAGSPAAGSKARPAAPGEPTTKYIAGIPVHNYEHAFEGLVQSEASAVDQGFKADWVVRLKKWATDQQVRDICEMAECRMMGNEKGLTFVNIHGSVEELEHMLMNSSDLAEFVEPDMDVEVVPEIGEEEEEEEDASVASMGPFKRKWPSQDWNLKRVGATAAQRAFTGKGVHIYVMDTGIRTTHAEFGGRAVPTVQVDEDGMLMECAGTTAPCAYDMHGHGTHCAGTAGGKTYGVAPDAVIHSVKLLSDSGKGKTSWILQAFDWFVSGGGQHPAVASMSLQSGTTSAVWVSVIDEVVEAGVTVVVASGNKAMDACNSAPAFVKGAVTVGSIDNHDVRSWFSNYGPCTNIWAPGSDITSAGAASDTDVRTMSGTSMACPHVSGGAALLLEEKPSRLPSEVRALLLQRAEKAGISSLTDGDVNELLWVGKDAAPQPDNNCFRQGAKGPDNWNECTCKEGTRCRQGFFRRGCKLASSPRRSRERFAESCANCRCK